MSESTSSASASAPATGGAATRDAGKSPVVLLTGATGGIGVAIARELAERNYRLVLMGRRRDRLDMLRDMLGQQVVNTYAIDLLESDAVAQGLAEILAEVGHVDVLINNAGAGIYNQFLDQSAEDHQRMLQLNYIAPASMIRQVLPGMIERGSGHVINVASMSSKVGPWGHAGYAAAKAALVSLTQTLASEYAHAGVHFTYVNPGIIKTPYFEQPETAGLWELVKKHAIPPDRLASAVARVLEKPQLEVCVPSHFRMLDVIRAVSPQWANRVVADGSRPRNGHGGV